MNSEKPDPQLLDDSKARTATNASAARDFLEGVFRRYSAFTPAAIQAAIY